MDIVELVQNARFKTFRRLWLTLLRLYFRVEVEGLEHIPKKGRALIIANHSGFAGVDALLLTFVIKRETRRRARILAHRAFFDYSERIKAVSESIGLRRASIGGAVELLKSGRLVIVFPEGEAGNFKPSFDRYHLQKFRTGFLRMAVESEAPIIPCVVLGAEETHLNLGNIDLSALARGFRIPLPLNLIPLPAKWKIVFFPPVQLQEFGSEPLSDPDGLRRIAGKLRQKLQKELRKRLNARSYVYSKIASSAEKAVKKVLKRSS
ncbi:MAG TPA: lysophospholipid acyltransferase family protein [Bdellovibrionota bacterium]|nr:lysophospholipid acyltransferase family protein [Bdellovibrionota bacterium]